MKNQYLPNIRQVIKSVFMPAITAIFLFLSGINLLFASCIEISDIPLDTKVQKAPGIVMFLIDDSGSMDWEFSCKAGNEGIFEGTYAYIFGDPNATGDNNFSSSSSNGRILETHNNGAGKNKWKSQWSGENQLYYDPTETYTPWPTYGDADPDNPRSDPTKSRYTLNLSGIWHNFNEVVMDNDNARNRIRWGDEDFGSFSSSGNWGTSTDSSYYERNYLYTISPLSTYTATWDFSNLVAGKYNVYAWWVESSNRSTSVQYDVNGTTVFVNQKENGGKWNLLAKGIDFGTSGSVILTHPDSDKNRACADAIKIVPSTGQIHRAHYYVQNENGTFLVNIDGSIKYYKFTDLNGDNIVSSNELTPLTGAEAAAAGIVTGRTYTEERQNFANWYSFYRRRELTAKNAISKVISDMEGVYIGLHSINYDGSKGIWQHALPVKVYDSDNVLQDESDSLLTTLLSMNSNGGTPLRKGLNDIGRYFKGKYGKPSPLPSTDFADDTYPFFREEKGGACQQAFVIAMTDGYWNGSFSGVGNADKDRSPTQIDGFDGPPFSDEYSNTLADVAMHYYEHDLNTTLNDFVPINALDHATHQHLVTYTLSFGVEGTINRDAYPDCPLGPCPTWTNPWANNLNKIDDLFHAAVNGRGKYVNASTPKEMIDAMDKLKQDIQSRLGSSAALATNSIQRQVGTTIYQGTYNTSGWYGEVSALSVNVETGAVGTAIWKASEGVPTNWQDRKIFSYDGSNGILFETAKISSSQEALLENNGHDIGQLVDFIRGDTSHNVNLGGTLRARNNHPIGDIVHSAPTYYKGVVYIGSNDGMLHAINAADGVEKFCYVPGMVYDHLSDLALPEYSHKYYVDGTPVAGYANTKNILVCGLGKGGKGYFGLDITDPDAMTENQVLWELPTASDDDMGYALSDVNIVNTKAAGKVVIFGNGYDSVNQHAVLYILENPDTATPTVHKLDTGVAGCNGLSSPRVVDVNADGYADYAFAGDLLGNMWKFDLRGSTTSEWKVYYNSGSPEPLITVRNSSESNFIQPITAAPEVMLDCSSSTFSNLGQGLMVIFGTGRYLNSFDFDDTSSTQSFYGIWDWGDIWEKKSGYETAKTKYMGTLKSDRTLTVNSVEKSLLEQTIKSENSIWFSSSDNAINWYDPDYVGDPTDSKPGEHMGWFFDLSIAGERGVRDPSLRLGNAVLISTIPSSTACEAGGNSVLYQVNACTGGQPIDPQFDYNNDNKIDHQDKIKLLPPSGRLFDQMLFKPIEIGDFLYLPDSEGNITPLLVPVNPTGMFFWRVFK